MRTRLVAPHSLKLHPLTHLIPPMRESEWCNFYADVAMRGINVPLEMLADGTVIDGKHRLRAALEIGMPRVPIVDAPLNGDSPEVYMLKAAVLRRHLTDDQGAALAAFWKEENKKQGERTDLTSAQRGAEVNEDHPTRAEAMDIFKVSRQKIDRATKVFHADPEKFQMVHRGDMKLNAAWREVKASLKPPAGQYAVIVIDPPWPYDSRNQDPTHRAANPYPSMSLDQIRQLHIPAASDSILWLWTTNAFHLLEAWGFQYKTMLIWVKEHMGLRISPGNATTVLIAANKSHSTKPEEFYALVERLCPGNRLEMFARRR